MNWAWSRPGVEMNGRFISVDKNLRTSAPNIWLLGDANGDYMFTHRATYDGPTTALNAVKDARKTGDYRFTKWQLPCTITVPSSE